MVGHDFCHHRLSNRGAQLLHPGVSEKWPPEDSSVLIERWAWALALSAGSAVGVVCDEGFQDGGDLVLLAARKLGCSLKEAAHLPGWSGSSPLPSVFTIFATEKFFWLKRRGGVRLEILTFEQRADILTLPWLASRELKYPVGSTTSSLAGIIAGAHSDRTMTILSFCSFSRSRKQSVRSISTPTA